MAISSVAIHNKLNGSTLTKQYKEHLSDFLEWNFSLIPDALIYPENFGPRMSLDEVALSNGELYTVLTNKDAKGKKGCLAALIKGTKSSIVCKALEAVPISIRFAVEEITLDLAGSMDWIVRSSFPNAVQTADRFHFQGVVTEAVQEVRIKLRRQAIDEDNHKQAEAKKLKQVYKPITYSNGDTKRQLLARSRYLLFKPHNKWTESQKERAEILFNKYPEIQKAYKLSMHFRGIFESKCTRETGKQKLDKWYEKVSSSGISELISAANTIERHEGKILNYFYTRSTNASAESFNAKLKGFRALLRGVSDINFFLYRVEKLYA